MLSKCSRRMSRTSRFPLRLLQTASVISDVPVFRSCVTFLRDIRIVHQSSPPEPPRPKYGVNSAFTILASPKLTPREDITRLLSSPSAYSNAVGYPSNKERGLVILATPLFTTWLEDKTFLAEIVQSIFLEPNPSSFEPVNVSTLAAVVDGLPAGVGSTNPVCHQRAEGLAFLSGDRESMLPGLWDSNPDSSQEGNTGPAHKKSITFFSINPNVKPSDLPFNTEYAQSVNVDVTVPLANTLFRNGRNCTLLASKWQRDGHARSFELLHHEERLSQRIDTTRFGSPLFPIQRTPLTVLTQTRTIAAGLGNIVSQILDIDRKPVPASRELEASIDAYLEVKKVPKQAVSVWALVTPEATFAMQNEARNRFRQEILADYSKSLESLCNDEKIIRKFWASPPNTNSYAGKWVVNGASLHRILSGGGGWGAKQGLLSLDPDTSLVTAPDARWNFDKHGLWEDGDQRKALGEIVKAGSKIQFLVASEPSKVPTVKSDGPDFLNLVVGCISSTLDDVPSLDNETNDVAARQKTPMAPRRISGQFGAQSETGFFIQHSVIPDYDKSSSFTFVSSKIDVPHSVWIARRRLRGSNKTYFENDTLREMQNHQQHAGGGI